MNTNKPEILQHADPQVNLSTQENQAFPDPIDQTIFAGSVVPPVAQPVVPTPQSRLLQAQHDLERAKATLAAAADPVVLDRLKQCVADAEREVEARSVENSHAQTIPTKNAL